MKQQRQDKSTKAKAIWQTMRTARRKRQRKHVPKGEQEVEGVRERGGGVGVYKEQ